MPSGRELWTFETTTGRVREVLPTTALSWKSPLASGGGIDATIPLGTPDTAYLDLRTLTTPWRFSLAVVQGAQVLCAGIIDSPRDWSSDSPNEIKVSASELWELLARRLLLGDYASVDPLKDVTFTSATLSGMAVELVNHAVNVVPNGKLPLTLPAQEPGDAHTRTYKGTDLKDAKSALDDLTKVENGPDVVFDAELSGDRSQVQWVMRVGRPMLTQAGEDLVLDYPGEQVDLADTEDPADMATTTLLTAQPQQTDESAAADTSTTDTGEPELLVARGDNPTLFGWGYPALWVHNGDHTDVNEQATLNGYAKSYSVDAATPTVERPFTIRVDHPDYPLGSYRRGDTAQIVVGEHPWTKSGAYRVRITELAVDDDKGTVQITVAEQPGVL